MQLTIGYSPCPNDTFIFDALVNNKIDTEGLEFAPFLEDVETLNKKALQANLDITKISYAVLPEILETYSVLNSGSALGNAVGPLLISAKDTPVDIASQTIAVPGENTTAHLLFSMAYPAARNKIFMRYDEIENYVSAGKGPGVIIHENRFTYQQKGLVLIADLGDVWEKRKAVPIPLGGIVVKRSLGPELHRKLNRLIKKSLEKAYSTYPVINDYVKQHAYEMEASVIRKHIDLYVNRFTADLGIKGKHAVKELISVYNEMYGKNIPVADIFAAD